MNGEAIQRNQICTNLIFNQNKNIKVYHKTKLTNNIIKPWTGEGEQVRTTKQQDQTPSRPSSYPPASYEQHGKSPSILHTCFTAINLRTQKVLPRDTYYLFHSN